jgi:tetratricopeptide (TPR) repeat protein
MSTQRAAAPVLSGILPPLADFYFVRAETGFGLADGLRPGETVVLAASAAAPASAASAARQAGGTGKTQLALGFAHAVWNARAVDILVWVPAASRDAILAGLALAAGELGADRPGETADVAARRFLTWLNRTRRRWAVVLDDVQSAADLEDLWPSGETGQVVVTTRLPEAALRGGGRTVLPVQGFSKREAVAYLSTRLVAYPDQRIESFDLAEDIGGLPVSLAQAAAVIVEGNTTCRDYRRRYAERLRNMAGAAVPGCPKELLTTWSLAVQQANELPPTGLAWPALALASALDPAGIPAVVLTSPAACGYITGRPAGSGTGQNVVRAAFGSLEKLGLISVDTTSPVPTVWVHATVQAAMRAYLADTGIEPAVVAAAAALLQTWPKNVMGRQHSQTLRACTASLRGYAGDLLWKPEAHPLLMRAGLSLEEDMLADSAVTYWESMAAVSTRMLGHGHAQSVMARDRLAAAYQAADRVGEALTVLEAALTDRMHNLGPDHPDTMATRVKLARACQAAGREVEAIAMYERTLADSERVFGSAHRDTLAVRASLAAAYQAAGRQDDCVRLYEATTAESERTLGPAHQDTLTVRASLAAAYQATGRPREAIAAYQRTVMDAERAQGPDHPDTLAARSALASAYRLAGKPKEAIAQYERILSDRERFQGPEHPDTLTARGNLAFAYRSAGKLKEAIPQYERTLADRERLQGSDHRDTITVRSNLAGAYQLARRLADAIPQYERAVADSEQILGPGHIDTLTTRCNLATAYYSAGRLCDVVTVLRRALADCEQYLGPEHPMTSTVRENLQAAAG